MKITKKFIFSFLEKFKLDKFFLFFEKSKSLNQSKLFDFDLEIGDFDSKKWTLKSDFLKKIFTPDMINFY